MSTAALALVLDSPLQSWGHASQFTHRTTASHPTKSGVIGLIAAAMGIDKYADEEEARLRPLAELKFSSIRVPRSHPTNPGELLPVLIMEDYHTIGGGYDEDTPRGKLSIPRRAERGGSFGTVVTHRRYLQQARFIVVLDGARQTLEDIAGQLLAPVWGSWLGRKCCVPATPMLHHGEPQTNVCATREEALAKTLKLLDCDLPHAAFESEETTIDIGNTKQVLADEPISFGKRRFLHRGVKSQPASSKD